MDFKMKKTKQKLRSKLRSVMATLIVSSMIQTSFAAGAGSGWTTQDTKTALGGVTQILGQYVQMRGQNMNMQIQQAANARTQQMMMSMQPQVGPAQFFPECPVLQRISNMPDKNSVCTGSSTNPADVGQMSAIQGMAAMASKKYESARLTSLECIANRQKAFDGQLVDFQNRLQAMADQLKQDSQTFRDNTDQMMSAMNSNWADLHGAGSSIDAKTGDFTKQFSPACATFLTGNKIDNKGGLVGMMELSKDANLAAYNFAQARPQIEASIVNDGNLISAAIKAGGVTAIDLNNVSQDNKEKISAIIQSELGSNKLVTDTYSKDIPSEMAFNVDAMNSADAEAKIKNAEANYKNNLMQKCMSGKSGSTLNEGLVIDSSTIDSLISQAGTDGGTAVAGYKSAVLKILNNSDSNVTLQMKLSQIQALDNNYKNIVFNSNVGGQNVSGSASQAFAKLASDCETFYTQASPDGGPSPQQKVQRAQVAMRQLKNAHDKLGDKIAQAVSSKLINCSTSQVNGTKACTAEVVKPASAGFCVANAATCSDQIQGCYGEVSAKVGQKTAAIKTLGMQYNAAANQMINRANQLFAQQKTAVAGLLSSIQQNYPGMKFVIGSTGGNNAGGANDPLFVSSPALSASTFGIDLVAGGQMGMEKFLSELPNKIQSLKNIIADQQKAAKAQVDEYLKGANGVPGLIESLDNQKKAWDDLAGQCKQAMDSSMQAIADANKKIDEQNANNQEFCKRYTNFATNPNPTCGGASKLISTMSKVVGTMPGSSVDFAVQVEDICASSNNDASPGGDKVKSTDIIVDDYCKDASVDNKKLFNKINKNYPSITLENLLSVAGDIKSSATPATPATAATDPKAQAETAMSEADNALEKAKEEVAAKNSAYDIQIAHEKALIARTQPNPPSDEEKLQEKEKTRLAEVAKKAAAEAVTKKTAAAEKAKKDYDAAVAAASKHAAPTAPATAADGIPLICAYVMNKSDTAGKNQALTSIIKSALELSGAQTSEQKSQLGKIHGQMRQSPCGSIANATGKGGVFLPWEAAPSATEGLPGAGVAK